jgi:predicted transposase/invertase (TIGR01784 family)
MFKAVFGNPHRSAPLRSFLESVLDIPHEDLAEVDIIDPHLPASHSQDKQGVVDVRLRTVSGRDINVEVQVLEQAGFRKRLAYYAAGMLSTQLSTGRDYEELTQAITVAITGFVVFPDKDGVFSSHFRLLDPDRGLELTDALQINILELPKLPLYDDGTLLWKWLRFMAVQTREELHMIAQLDPVIADAAEEVERFNQSRDMYLAYLSLDRAKRDRISNEAQTRRREEEWRVKDEEVRVRDEEVRVRDEEVRVREEEARVREEELQRREEQIRTRQDAIQAQGAAEGVQRARREVAQAMLEAGMPAGKVSELTGLSLEDIAEL